jgi:spore maturation protein CgeB
VYGEGWDDLIPPRFVRATHFPNDQLAHLYASAEVVLNDHWPDMREQGFISNRIFDSLASGAVVVSDRVAGLEEMFGDLVPTYADGDELKEVVWDILKDSQHRSEMSRSAAQLMAREHTFERRAHEILDLLRPFLNNRPSDLGGGELEL